MLSLHDILRSLREAIQATGAPPDVLQAALSAAERSLRRSLDSEPEPRQPPIKARIADLSEEGLGTAQISGRLGISDRHVRRVLQMLRRGG